MPGVTVLEVSNSLRSNSVSSCEAFTFFASFLGVDKSCEVDLDVNTN